MSLIKRIGCLVVLLGALLPSNSHAQTAKSLRINYSEVSEGEDALLLSIYFTLIDDSGQAVTNAQIQSAEIILLEDGSHYGAQVKKADTPFYITLVLDASGSMMRAGEDLRNAAKQAISDAPQGARFSVVKFNDTIEVLRDFTEDEDSVARAIDKVEPVYNAGTCLYDAAYQAVELLGKTPPGRRAVVLFTDGKDEKAGGGICSDHTYDEVVDLAVRPEMHVPLHTIGLSGSQYGVNATELENMASTTGGFSAIGSQGNLSSMFGQIMDALNSQWLAQAYLYPTQGRHEAAVQIVLRDGTTLSATVSFESSRAYFVPATAAINRVEYNAETDVYTVYLYVTSPQMIDHLKVAVWDVRSGIQVAEYTFRDLTTAPSFQITSQGLQAGREYELRIAALGPSDEPVLDAQGNPIALAHKVSYNPVVLKTKVGISSVLLYPEELVINVQVENGQQVSRYEGWLNDEATKTQVPTTTFTLSALPADNAIHVSMAGMKEGKYTIVLRAIGADGVLLSEAEDKGVVYTPPAAPPEPSQISIIIGRILSGLRARPWILIVMVGIIVLAMAALVAIPLIARRQTGTPVLQGKLEANLSPKGRNLPINLTRVMEPGALPPKSSIPPPVKAAPSGLLKVSQSPDPANRGKAFRIGQGLFTLGREECTLNFSQDYKVSRKHASITFDAASATFYITDLGSANGLWLNGVRVPPNRPTPLINGMAIGLGPDTRLVFERAS